MTSAILPGFALGFSLILAIGAQNAFVLRQGLRREHVLAVVLTCALSDAVLIAAGVTGMGRLAQAAPWFAPLMRFGGAAFLIWYGAGNLWTAWRGGVALQAAGQGGRSLRATLVTCLALTWLNPHVYLDTVVLIGSVSAQYGDRAGFGLGAAASSFAFFFALGYGARLLAPLLARPGAWRLLDGAIGLVMWSIAVRLIVM
ncbi:MAG: LysE/ArgO family amino acid transporter [Pseudodonghicola sp.]